MTDRRQSGILLHPTALPSSYSSGDLGQEAFNFVDFLARAGQHLWQVLPLSPPGYGDSPYSALSTFAGNLGLVSLEQLVAEGDLKSSEIPRHQPTQVSLQVFKRAVLRNAVQRFNDNASTKRRNAFEDFCAQSTAWLEDYVLFVSLHEQFGHRSWDHWPRELRYRQPSALTLWQNRLAAQLQTERYAQFVFFEQWQRLKEYAHQRQVSLYGDLPLYVAYDSADVWAAPGLFQLDEQLQPSSVAGVPPDYFSDTGQRWGNPLYRWQELHNNGFEWWLRRLSSALEHFDLLRIDHFRGLEACWSIPSTAESAREGHWETVPGRQLLEHFFARHPDAPLIAEDLGIITPEVEQLRRDFALPGMKVLQFAFDSGPDNPYLPANLTNDSVVYTGTHDNDTTLGWWTSLDNVRQRRVEELLGRPCRNMPWDLIRVALESPSQRCIIPLPDLLCLGSDARFNRPGTSSGNWSWRLPAGRMTPAVADALAELTTACNR